MARLACIALVLAAAGCGRVYFDGLADAASDDGATDATALRTYRDVVLEDVPLSYWRFADSNGVARDEMGRVDGSYNGSCVLGSPGALAGDPDPSLFLDASTCHVALAAQTPFNGLSPFSLEVWAFHINIGTSTGYQTYLMNETRDINGPLDGYSLLLSNNAGVYVERAAGGTNRFSPRQVITAQAWHHIVGTFDGSVLTLYIDGTMASVSTMIGTSADSTGALSYIGAQTTGNASGVVDGYLDEVAIYDHALTPERVAEHYRIGTLGPE